MVIDCNLLASIPILRDRFEVGNQVAVLEVDDRLMMQQLKLWLPPPLRATHTRTLTHSLTGRKQLSNTHAFQACALVMRALRVLLHYSRSRLPRT